MQNQYFQHLNLNPLVKPVHELMELNAKTIQNLSFVTPVDLLSAGKPEEIVQKNMNALIKNTNTVMDYMQDLFHIFEKNLFHNQEQVLEPIESSLKKAVRTVYSKTSTPVKAIKSNVRSGVSSLRDANKTISKKVKASVKKNAAPSPQNKASNSVRSNVSQTDKSQVTKQKKSSSPLKSVVKSINKESEHPNIGQKNTKPDVQVSTESKKDPIK